MGFNIPGNDAIAYDRDGADSTRTIMELDWVEVSSVVRGASPSTMTIAAKSETETVTMPEVVPDVEPEPEEPETDTGADQPDEPGQAAPDTDVQSASSTVQARLRLLRSRLQLQGIKTN